jgi:hypothetical protein
MTNRWHLEFISWIENELKEKVPSSQNLTNLLSEYAESNKNNLEIKGNLQDWIEDNREDVLNSIESSRILEIVYDKDADYNSSESASIGLLNEKPPNRQRVQPREDVESFPQILLLQNNYDQLRDEIGNIKKTVDEIKNNIGTKNNSEYNLYEFLRNHDKELNEVKQKNSILENKILEIGENIGRRGNLTQDIFEWIRSKNGDLSRIDNLSNELDHIRRNLGLHIGNGSFESQTDTFKTHLNHTLLALVPNSWKEKGLIPALALSVGTLVTFVYFGSSQWNDYTELKTNFSDLNKKVEDIGDELEQFRVEMDKIKDSNRNQGNP